MIKWDKEELIEFINRFISIGVTDYEYPSELFFYYGILRYIDDQVIKLKTKNGYKIIRLTDIMDVHETRRKQ